MGNLPKAASVVQKFLTDLIYVELGVYLEQGKNLFKLGIIFLLSLMHAF